MSPRHLDVSTGNPYALLSDLPQEVAAPLREQEATDRTAGPKPETRRSRESGTGRTVLATRKPLTLGDFLPRSGVTKKTRTGRKQRLDLTALGEDGMVTDRVKIWSETSLSQREFDLSVADSMQVPSAYKLREAVSAPVVQAWVSTPVDCEAS